MSWTLGAYTTLHNPLNAEAKPRRDVAAYEVWRMANGTVRKHIVGAERWIWEPRFDVGGSDYTNLLAAYVAAAVAATGVAFVSWDTGNAIEYSAIVHSWEDDAYTAAGGTIRHRVRLTIEEQTA